MPKKFVAIAAVVLVSVLGLSGSASAQRRSRGRAAVKPLQCPPGLVKVPVQAGDTLYTVSYNGLQQQTVQWYTIPEGLTVCRTN